MPSHTTKTAGCGALLIPCPLQLGSDDDASFAENCCCNCVWVLRGLRQADCSTPLGLFSVRHQNRLHLSRQGIANCTESPPMKPSCRTLPKEFVTVAECAAILGLSTQAVYKGLRSGRVPWQRVKGRRCIERAGLERRWWGSSQRLADRPAPPPPASEPPAWDQIAAAANQMLDPDLWGPPPWPADRWATLAMVLSLAVDGE